MDERRDDWKHGVDENLASLNAGQRVWEEELKRVRDQQEEFDRLIRGDPEQDTDGLMSRLHSFETDVRKLNAIILKDSTGSPGLQGRVEKLEGKRDMRVERWKLYVAIIGMISAILVAVITNLDHIENVLHRHPALPKPTHTRRHRPKPPPPPEPEAPESHDE